MNDKLRLDKWLWAARFYKTRAVAKQAIEGGKVHCQGSRTKPSKEIEIGTADAEDNVLKMAPHTAADTCPAGNPNRFTPLPIEEVRLWSPGSNGRVLETCRWLDINGDSLPDYICSWQVDGGNDANSCVYRNTGSGLILF